MQDFRRLEKQIRRNIAEQGQHIIMTPDGRPWAFSYTIGNAERGLPELLVIGAANQNAGILLNILGELQRKTKKAMPTATDIQLGPGVHMKVRTILANDTAKRDYTLFVTGYYGRDNYTVHQVIMCDPNGRWPGMLHCAKPWDDIPILFPKVLIN